jgi:hypothetical protein
MTNDTLPIDVNYDDPREPTVMVDDLLAAGKRARTRRRIAVTAAALVVLGGATAGIATSGWTPGHGGSVNAGVAAPQEPDYGQHPPSDRPVTVDQSVAGWKSFAYVSGSTQICGGSSSTTGHRESAFACWATMAQATDGTWVALPAFQALPRPTQGKVLAIGLVRGRAQTVDVTFAGHTVTAAVVPVPVNGNTDLGAYAVWLPTEGKSVYGTSDISAVVAKSSNGDVVARLP